MVGDPSHVKGRQCQPNPDRNQVLRPVRGQLEQLQESALAEFSESPLGQLP